MVKIFSEQDFFSSLRAVPVTTSALGFYDHRFEALVTDPRLMLIPADDHLVHRGDGLFEAMKFVDRRIYQLDAHLERMRNAADSILLSAPCSWSELRALVLDIAVTIGADSGVIRIFMGRGQGGFGINPMECKTSSLYIIFLPFSPRPESWYTNGLKGFRSSIPARPNHLSHIKSNSYLPAVLMMFEAHERGCDTPFAFDSDGFLSESAVANICIVDRAGCLVVPEFKSALPGTTILRAIELLNGRVECMVRPISESEIFEADEVLLLSTSPDCVSVVEYEGRKIGSGRPGQVSGLLRELIRKDIIEYGVEF